MSNTYFKNKYDVVIIGGGVSGLGSALTLSTRKLDILVLEQHNTLGGVATSFVRNNVEYETALHEMMSVGPKEYPLSIRRFFDSHGVDIEWVRVPEAFRLVTPDIDITIHAGMDGTYDIPAREIADYLMGGDDLYKKLLSFFKLCRSIYDAVSGNDDDNKFKKASNYMNLVGTAGYSVLDVLKSFDIPEKAMEILSTYWMYLGNVIGDLPFSVYAIVIADYFGYGSYFPKNTSYEISLKMAEAVKAKGVQIECGVRVDNILVENKVVKGVKLSNGTIINCDYVISGSYPNKVYTQMIEPKEEISKDMIKYVNSRVMSCTCFSVILLLDKDYKDLGITNYATFSAPNGMNFDEIWNEMNTMGPWNYFTSICNNVANPDASPKGTCIYSMTALPLPQAFDDLTVENYEEIKRKNALYFIEEESKRLGVNLLDHILEITIETPVTISHFVGSWNGCIYGYLHSMNDHAVARVEMKKKEQYISGLTFNGAHHEAGDGIATVINNGRKSAQDVFVEMTRRRRANKNGD